MNRDIPLLGWACTHMSANVSEWAHNDLFQNGKRNDALVRIRERIYLGEAAISFKLRLALVQPRDTLSGRVNLVLFPGSSRSMRDVF